MSFDYKKSLGQNFLKDNNIIKEISNSIIPNPDDLIIEIGPGDGALTKELITKKCEVICFEIDKRLESSLNRLKTKNLKIVFEDFLKIKISDYIDYKKYNRLFFVGNLPYYITTAIINKIVGETSPYEIIIMIQKEVAERYMSSPKSKKYGSISVFLQYNFDIEKICNVSKNCFEPIPKVDSMVIRLKKKDRKNKPNNENLFYKIIKDAFKQKRKTIKNNLYNYDLTVIDNVLKKYNKSINSRAEELTVDEFIDLSNNLNA